MLKDPPSPPALSHWILGKALSSYSRAPILGDLQEEFEAMGIDKGTGTARRWYRRQALKSLPPAIVHFAYWSIIMFKNYLIVAFRHLKKEKGFALINLAGLTVGLTAGFLIFLWVQDEVGYDRFHEKGHDIHRVESNLNVQPAPLAPALKRDYAEILDSVRIYQQRTLVSLEEMDFFEDDFSFADGSLFDIFTLPFVKGDPATALKEPNTLVMSRRMVRKYFGHGEPVGRTLRINGTLDLKVTGVIEDPPSNSTLRLALIASFPTLENQGFNLNDWGNHLYETYVLLRGNASREVVEGKIADVVKKRLAGLNLQRGLSLEPLTRIHLYEEGRIKNVIILASVAVFVLLIAFINFVNLTTARGESRAQEVGVRKVVGARRGHLIGQFLGESVVFSVTAFLLSLVLLWALLPTFNVLAAKQLALDLPGKLPVLLIFLTIALTAGIAAGSYPAFYLSSFHPTKVIRRSSGDGPVRGSRLRTLLVVFQFAVSVFLIIVTLMVGRQLDFIRGLDPGFAKEHVITIDLNRGLSDRLDAFRDRLKRHPGIQNVAFASSLPSNVGNTASGIDWEGNEAPKKLSWQFVSTDEEYFDTLKMSLAEGRNFPRDSSPGSVLRFILNEKAVEEAGLPSPVGKWFSLWGLKGPIIGVVKNFHFRSVHTEIRPLIIFIHPDFYEHALVRIAPGMIRAALDHLDTVWKELSPLYPFEYHFLDESIDRLYVAEVRMGRMFRAFALLSVFISCLGLFGLAAYTAKRRTREIGIRKVFGATPLGVVAMMAGTYTKWVLVANLIAWPAAFLFVKAWLRNFAYRTGINLSAFILSGVLALGLALATISWQSVKAATAVPSDSIRYE